MFKILVSDYFDETYPDEWEAIRVAVGPEQIVHDPSEINDGDVVLPRYRTVPFGDLLETEVAANGGRLINTAEQSANVRDLFHWVEMLGEYTAKTYTIDDLNDLPEGRYFVKGSTSSLKYKGPTAVFADTRDQAIALAHEVVGNDWLANESVAIRERQDYRQLGYSKKGLPVFNEQRVFTYRGSVLSHGFYWSEQRVEAPVLTSEFWSTVEVTLPLVKDVADFLVVDYAEYSDGRWGVVELNDGCQAGFAAASPLEVYRGLADAIS